MRTRVTCLLAMSLAAVLSPGCRTIAPGEDVLGKRCLPALERKASFAGFDENEVTVDVNAQACGGGTCLVNHFRGRVSCPYGQDRTGAPPAGAPGGCVVPETNERVAPGDERGGEQVRAQCTDRRADEVVYCTCRCANAAGRTDDGATYCDCADGFACTQLVTSIGRADEATGAYCMKAGTAYDRSAGACASSCDPIATPCSAPPTD